jgi:hypothetical protein
MVEFVLGIVAAILVFGIEESWRHWRSKRKEPRLSLTLVPDLSPSKVDKGRCSFGRLELSNAAGKEAATGVSVRIKQVTASGDGRAPQLQFLGEHALAWAGADRGKSNVQPSFITLAADSSRQIDLLHLNEVTPKEVIVDVRPQPGSKLNYLEVGSFTFDLAVAADNLGTRRYAVDAEFRSGWTGEYADAGRHLTLKNLRALS